jgi:hypothetical protein
MYRQADKYYADWLDIDGVRHRKSFDRENEALAHEHLQAAIKYAIKLGREERAMTLWESYDLVEQPLRALTDAAGLLPFTFKEVEKSVHELAQKTGPATLSHLAGLNRQIRRKMLLNLILSAVMESDPASANTREPDPGNLKPSATNAAFDREAAN